MVVFAPDPTRTGVLMPVSGQTGSGFVVRGENDEDLTTVLA
jgi:hypothetical protein